MHNPVTWIGGWAFNLACWRSHLVSLYPGREHTFLDAHAILEEPSLLASAAKNLPPGGTLIAWSLGSLLLHRGLAQGEINASCKFISISPIFDFCREGGPWSPSVLFKMARKLPKDRHSVLTDFFALLQGDSEMDPAQTEAWKRQANKYSLDSLLLGLEALGGIKVAPETIPANTRIIFLASELDPLAPSTSQDFSRPGWISYPQGHLPFLDYPDLVKPLLIKRNSV
jgi:hypothetical protein